MFEDKVYQQAADLAFAVWRGIDSEFKAQYTTRIWDIFESRLRTAASHNSSLVRFTSDVSRRLSATIGKNQRERDIALAVIESGQDEVILEALRMDTPYIVMLVRVRMQEIKEQFENELNS